MREEEAWRHIQEQDDDNDEEEDQETIPKDRLELSRKRPQESIDEQKESNVDQRRPVRTRRQEKGPPKPTESQQEPASNSKGSRKGRPTGDHAMADESQETGRLLDPLENWYDNSTQVQIPVQREAKRRPDERKQHDTEALESRIEVPETPAQRGTKRKPLDQKYEETHSSESRIEVPETLGQRRMRRRSDEHKCVNTDELECRIEVLETPGLRGARRSSELQEDTVPSVNRIEVPETPGPLGVKRRSEEQLLEDTEEPEGRFDGTCIQDNSQRRTKRRRTGVG